MLPQKKGMMLWNIPWCEGGDIKRIADVAEAAHLSHVQVKINDGVADHNIVNGIDLAAQLVTELSGRGITVWGWGYIYCYQPKAEAQKATERISETGVAGYIIDAETECKNKPTEVSTFCHVLRNQVGDLSIGLSSFRFPSLHPELPWSIFRSICQFDQPQVYWQGAHNSVQQLNRSYTEFKNMSPALPFVPTLAAYKWEGWQPTPQEVDDAIHASYEYGFSGVNFWEWYNCRRYLQPVWDVISAFDWGEIPPGEIPETVYINTDVLNIRSEPSSIQGELTVIGTTPKNKPWSPVAIRTDENNKEWWECGKKVFLAKWLTRE